MTRTAHAPRTHFRRHHEIDVDGMPRGTAGTDAPHPASRITKLLGTLVLAAGVVLTISGAATWTLVQTSLSDERITVAEDASWFAGQHVNGPFTAFSEAQTIEKHSLEASGGKTYAELDRKDPVRATVMNGSFLRASLFTSVLAFGVSATAMGLGLLFAVVGIALRRTAASAPEGVRAI
jgi:hypothetical protein